MQPSFLACLSLYASRVHSKLPVDTPPCGALGIAWLDRALAGTFNYLAGLSDDDARMDHLQSVISFWRRRLAQVREADPANASLHGEIEAVIRRLKEWFKAIHAEPWNGRRAA